MCKGLDGLYCKMATGSSITIHNFDTKIKFNKLTDSSIQIYALYTDCIFVLLSDPEESGFSGLHFPLSLN